MDRFFKIYILKIAELESNVDIYINSYLNFYLIWNKGIAFGLFSFEETLIYQLISLVIFAICIVLTFMIIKSDGLKKSEQEVKCRGGALFGAIAGELSPVSCLSSFAYRLVPTEGYQ